MKKITSLVIILLITLNTYAVPAYRGWQTKSQPDGTTIQLRLVGDEFHHYWADAEGNIVRQDANGYWRVVETKPTAETIAARRKASPMLQSRPKRAIGDRNFAPRGLVILVNFKDSKFATGNSQSAMHDLMNSDSYTYNGATGSVRQYFSDQSDGQYTPEFDVVGPVTLKNNVAHYGGNNYNDEDKLPGDMVVEACSIAMLTMAQISPYTIMTTMGMWTSYISFMQAKAKPMAVQPTPSGHTTGIWKVLHIMKIVVTQRARGYLMAKP